MDPRQISKFAKLLREDGDKVLNSEYKLTLTGALLRALNDSFSLIVDANEICTVQSFQVVKPNNCKSEVFRELQFIYDFVQKTQILCITTIPNEEPFEGAIDITKFRNLRRLEVQRVPIEQICGIQPLRAQLHEIICSKSITSVKDIISHCGGDKSNGFMWNELKVADFSYNTLKTIDCSLEFAPFLQQLNLSHNKIFRVDAIKWLPNLKKLNLSYNSLTYVPHLHGDAARRLQTLILTNNFIEDLNGIARLDSVSELNLSNNCILDHAALMPLSTLIALQYLHLHGNPISCHPKHREITARYLHKNTASVKFILDYEPLSKYEKSLTGHYQIYHPLFPRANASHAKRSSGQSTPASKRTTDNSPASSVGSIRSIRTVGSLVTGDNTPTTYNDSMNSSQISTSTQKKLKARRAYIADNNEENSKEFKRSISEGQTKDIIQSMEGNKEHLETKKKIEKLRDEYGDSWLHSRGAEMVHELIGNSPAPESDNYFKTGPPETNDQLILNFFGHQPCLDNDYRTSTPLTRSKNDNVDKQQTVDSDASLSTGYQTAQTDVDNNAESGIDESSYKTIPEEDNSTDIYGNPSYSTVSEPDPVSDTEDNQTIYIVIVEPNDRTLLLVVSDQSIREKDSMTGRTITKWNMSGLESCERIKMDVLRLHFDTIKRDKKERVYKVEEGLGQKLEQFLRNILSKRPLSEMNQTIFRCANCTAQFSRENLFRNYDVTCPECSSTYVIEIREPSPRPPSVEKSCKKQASLEKCESHSSIGSASSFNESSSNSKISHSQSSFDSTQSLIGSSTNCDQSADIDMYFAARFGAPPDSDVEILSNPSISSIEVLDQFSRHSSRKHSEDRRFLINEPKQQFLQQQPAPQQHQFQLTSQLQYPLLQPQQAVATSDDLTQMSDFMHDPGPTGSGMKSDETRTGKTRQQWVGTNQCDNQSIDTLGSGWHSSGGELTDCSGLDDGRYSSADLNIPSSNSDVEELNDETAASLMHRQTSTDDLDILVTGCTNTEEHANGRIGKAHRKTVLSGMNLTESSSSGSVTDSICTAYEQQQTTDGKGSRDTITTSTDGLITASKIGLTTSTTATPVTIDSKIVSSTLNEADEKNLSQSKVNEMSTLTTMIGGLFQSTNLLMQRNSKSNTVKELPPCDEFKFSYTNFDQVDHRLKLFLYQNIFEDDNEHLKWLVKGRLFSDSSSSDPEACLQPAIFIMSTTKWYILNIIGRESDDLTKWIKRQALGTIDRVETIRVLPWKIGVTFTIKFFGNIHFLLQDIMRTDSLLLFFANNPLPSYCSLAYQISERLSQKLLQVTGNAQLKILAILNSCYITSDHLNETYEHVAFITTDSYLYLTTSKYGWLMEKFDYKLDIAQSQLMTNLVDVDNITDTSFTINFLDEINNRTELWKCTFETNSCLDSTFKAIAQSWEEYFKVPLAN